MSDSLSAIDERRGPLPPRDPPTLVRAALLGRLLFHIMPEHGLPAQGAQPIETLAIAAGCLQAVMTMLHPDLVKFVAVQKERVARTDAERRAMGLTLHSRRFETQDNKNLSPEQQTDLSFQLKYLSHYWRSHLQNYRLDPDLLDVVTCALVYRNKVSHQSQMILAEYKEAIATFERLAGIIECNALARQKIRDLVTKLTLLSFSPSSKTQEAQIEPKPEQEETDGDIVTKEMPIEPEEQEEVDSDKVTKKMLIEPEDEEEEADDADIETKVMPIEPEEEEEIQDINENIPALLKTSDNLQELTSPKFHFAGAIRDITKRKNKSTVFTLKSVGQRWTIRVVPSSSGANDAFDAAKAIAGAEVGNAMLVFWRSSPPLEMIDRKALTVPMESEVYGQNVAIYIVKCSFQVLGVEVCQLRRNKNVESLGSLCEIPLLLGEELCACDACKVVNYCTWECLRLSNHYKSMKNEVLCSHCKTPALLDEELLTCSACKVVKYCGGDCQERHWKRIHRHMCKNTQLLKLCSTWSVDVTTGKQRKRSLRLALLSLARAITSLVAHLVYVILLFMMRAIELAQSASVSSRNFRRQLG